MNNKSAHGSEKRFPDGLRDIRGFAVSLRGANATKQTYCNLLLRSTFVAFIFQFFITALYFLAFGQEFDHQATNFSALVIAFFGFLIHLGEVRWESRENHEIAVEAAKASPKLEHLVQQLEMLHREGNEMADEAVENRVNELNRQHQSELNMLEEAVREVEAAIRSAKSAEGSRYDGIM